MGASLSTHFLDQAFATSNSTGIPHSQGSHGTIAGAVTDSTGAALYDVLVIVGDSAGKIIGKAKTDEYGKYSIKELPAGTFTVKAEGKGIREVVRTDVKLNSGATETVKLVAEAGPERIPLPFRKSRVLTMAELARQQTAGVSAAEVSDYVFGGYQGEFPSPPHADLNPKKAYIVFWKDFPYRFVFCHEGSYCPWFELPSGAGQCYQFFEGNTGWAELFNDWGRKERNSFVDIIESGPKRAWVRWTYFGVNMASGERAYRGTEDFWAYPNGLIVRRQSYEPLILDNYRGYSREPIEIIAMCPVGRLWLDVLAKDSSTGERHALAVLDAFSSKRYDVFWKHKPGTLWGSTHRKEGCAWKEIEDTRGVLISVPMEEASPFCIFGDSSGFQHDYTHLKDHTFTAEIWGSSCWDHWPIGWLNSQAHPVDEKSLYQYPNHFSPLGMDFFALPDVQQSSASYYSLLGVAGSDLEPARAIARQWLGKGPKAIANNPDSGRDLSKVFS